jgi:hypothetical protein
VEQSGDDGVSVEVEVRQEKRGFQGVCNIGLARFSELPAVAFVREGVRLPDQLCRIIG